MKTLALAALATVALSIPVATANSAPGPVIVTGGWGCRDCGFLNGTQLTGIASPNSDRFEAWDDEMQGTLLNGMAVDPGKPTVSGVILSTGEIIDLR